MCVCAFVSCVVHRYMYSIRLDTWFFCECFRQLYVYVGASTNGCACVYVMLVTMCVHACMHRCACLHVRVYPCHVCVGIMLPCFGLPASSCMQAVFSIRKTTHSVLCGLRQGLSWGLVSVVFLSYPLMTRPVSSVQCPVSSVQCPVGHRDTRDWYCQSLRLGVMLDWNTRRLTDCGRNCQNSTRWLPVALQLGGRLTLPTCPVGLFP